MNQEELTDIEYLRDLSERLMHVPATYGTDQYDCDRLHSIATTLSQVNGESDASRCEKAK